jgi:hypothetical protein
MLPNGFNDWPAGAEEASPPPAGCDCASHAGGGAVAVGEAAALTGSPPDPANGVTQPANAVAANTTAKQRIFEGVLVVTIKKVISLRIKAQGFLPGPP